MGAYIGYQYFIKNFNLEPLAISFNTQKHKIGDIAKLAGINSTFSYLEVNDTFIPDYDSVNEINFISSKYPNKQFKFVSFDPEIIKLRQQSDVLISYNPKAKYDQNILIFTDSFGEAFVPFLQATFTRVYWVNRYLDSSRSLPLIKKYLSSPPDFLIYLCVERMIGE